MRVLWLRGTKQRPFRGQAQPAVSMNHGGIVFLRRIDHSRAQHSVWRSTLEALESARDTYELVWGPSRSLLTVKNTETVVFVGDLVLSERNPDSKPEPRVLIGGLEHTKLCVKLGTVLERLATGKNGATVANPRYLLGKKCTSRGEGVWLYKMAQSLT